MQDSSNRDSNEGTAFPSKGSDGDVTLQPDHGEHGTAWLRVEQGEKDERMHELEVHQAELEAQNRELREARLTLEQFCKHYADLYDFAPTAYFTFDGRGLIYEVNVTGATMVGRERTSLIGCPFLSFVTVEDPAQFLRHLQHCIKTREPVAADLTFSLGSRGPLAVQAVSVPVRDGTGDAVQVRTAFMDISKRKLAEAVRDQAYQSEQKLRALLEALDQASMAISAALASVARSSLDTVLDIIRTHACAIADAAHAEVVQEPHAFSLAAAPVPTVLQGPLGEELHASILYAGRPLGVLRLRKHEGAAFSAQDVRGIHMLVQRVASAIETARLNQIEARERLRLVLLERTALELQGPLDVDATLSALTRLTRALLPDLADMCALFVAHGSSLRPVSCAHIDPAAEQMWRQLLTTISLEQLAPASLLRELVDTQRSVLCYGSASAVPEGDPDELGLRELHDRFSAQSIMVVALVARDRLVGAFVFARVDNSHYGHIQRVLAEEVASRCAFAIDNAQLLEELRAAVRSRDNLLAVVSHDLRTPLSTIVLSAGALTPYEPERERRNSKTHVDRIKQSAKWMHHLIDDLLTLSDLENHGFNVTRRAGAPTTLVDEACQMAEPLATLKGQHLEQVMSPDLPEVYADHDRVLQVLSNLIGNALKFTPQGGTIRVAAIPFEGAVRFSVSDTGVGIAPHQLARVFERCWTGETDGKGLGLGLYIAQRIVEAHGGRIWVESVKGQGTTFHFTVPTVSVAAVAQRPSLTR